jgi:hypothetical protein
VAQNSERPVKKGRGKERKGKEKKRKEKEN